MQNVASEESWMAGTNFDCSVRKVCRSFYLDLSTGHSHAHFGQNGKEVGLRKRELS